MACAAADVAVLPHGCACCCCCCWCRGDSWWGGGGCSEPAPAAQPGPGSVGDGRERLGDRVDDSSAVMSPIATATCSIAGESDQHGKPRIHMT